MPISTRVHIERIPVEFSSVSSVSLIRLIGGGRGGLRLLLDLGVDSPTRASPFGGGRTCQVAAFSSSSRVAILVQDESG